MMKGIVRFAFKLPANVTKKGHWFISKCPLLDVYSQGKNKKEALANLEEALKLFIESCYQRGTLVRLLTESGFEAAENNQELPDKQQEYVNVPLSLIAGRKHAEACAN
jgi:predicted RNase H-like HicB family nuclease